MPGTPAASRCWARCRRTRATIRRWAPSTDVVDPGIAAPAGASPAAIVSSRIDTIALILADEPVTREQLEPLLDALQAHATAVNVEGLVDEQWIPVQESPRDEWRELRAGLQLASRAGPVAEEEIAAFNETVAGFAASINAVSQRESPAAAAARSRELDRFCAEADIEVAVNVVGRVGATFALPRVKSLALEHGFAETGSGVLRAPRAGRRDGDARCGASTAEPRRDAGLRDRPHLRARRAARRESGGGARRHGPGRRGVRARPRRRARRRRAPPARPPAGIAAIRRSLEEVARRMEAHGIPAGGALARRLFS